MAHHGRCRPLMRPATPCHASLRLYTDYRHTFITPSVHCHFVIVLLTLFHRYFAAGHATTRCFRCHLHCCCAASADALYLPATLRRCCRHYAIHVRHCRHHATLTPLFTLMILSVIAELFARMPQPPDCLRRHTPLRRMVTMPCH